MFGDENIDFEFITDSDVRVNYPDEDEINTSQFANFEHTNMNISQEANEIESSDLHDDFGDFKAFDDHSLSEQK